MRKRRLALFLAAVLTLSAGTLSHAQQIGIWTSPGELAGIPVEGCAWDKLKAAADKADPNAATTSNMDSNNNAELLASAIVYSRTHLKQYEDKVVAAIEKLVSGGKPNGDSLILAWSRETAAYVMAADLIGYRTVAFEKWCRNMAEVWAAGEGKTMLQIFKQRPNNWGSHAFASLAALYSYLRDYNRLKEIRDYWIQSVVGPKPPEMRYGSDLSWHADKNRLQLINPAGSSKKGMNIDGIIPDDMRRGSSFSSPPTHTEYPWEHMQGLVVAAQILDRMGMPIWTIGNDAIYRAAYALQVRLEGTYGGWKAAGDDEWLMPFLDEAYGTDWRHVYDPCLSRVYRHGKNAGWGWITLKEGKAE